MEKGRVDGILIPIPTSSIVTTLITKMINSTIARGRVAGLLIPKPTSYINCSHSKISMIINITDIKLVGGKIDGISRKIPIILSSLMLESIVLLLLYTAILLVLLLSHYGWQKMPSMDSTLVRFVPIY